jgi:peptidyl-prolyl cis-trans isomerase A (cyclophilin A)
MRTSRLAVPALLAFLFSSGAAVAAEDPTGGKFTLADATKGLSGAGKLTAVIETSLGTFTCDLFDKEAPITVANFVGLARGTRPYKDPKTGEWKKGPFYDGLIFHRVIPGFMIQGGDIQGDGTGEPGYTIEDEKNAPHDFSKGGVLAMANRGPNTGGSQFFITEKETPMLDDGHGPGHYQIFGDCHDAALVKKIAAVPRSRNDRPNDEVKIVKVTIKRGGGGGGGGKKTK